MAEEIKNEEVKTIQVDIEKMKAASEQLKTAGADLFAEEIKNLQTKIENAEKELAAAADGATSKVKEVEQTFVQKYGADIVKGTEIVLLALIAGRILGVI
jgi:ElaB/YqjD/DUF883 family membrane-anchored ribosome-binding protein